MTDRLLPAPKRLALVARENAWGFAALVVIAAAWYGLNAMEEDAMEWWMRGMPRLLAVCAPLVVVGSFRQRTAGGAVLWLQRPVDPLRFHFARFLEVALVAVASATLFRCAAVAVGLAGGWEPEAHPLQPLPADALRAVAIAAVGFGLSCWWGERGRLAAFAYFALSAAAVVQMDLAGTPEGPWAQVVRALSLPSTASLEEAVRFLAWSPGGDGLAVAWFLLYVAAWLGVGAVGIRILAESRAR